MICLGLQELKAVRLGPLAFRQTLARPRQAFYAQPEASHVVSLV
jgi:hypothetical protein